MSTQSSRKTSKGPKPNPLTQSNRMALNKLARKSSIKRRLEQQHGREAENELPEYASGINAASGPERDQRLKATINALREERQKTETNKTRAGTKRKGSPTPSLIHTDYSTNSEREELDTPPKKSFREEYKNQPNVKKTNSEIFRVTRKALEKRSHERNEASKSRSQKRAKTQSAPGLLEQFENLVGNVLHKISTFTKLKGT